MADEGDGSFCENPQGPVVIVAMRSLAKEILAIERPSLNECTMALQEAFKSSWHSLSAWLSVLTLFLSPVLQFIAVLARAVWPHARTAATSLWKYQASLPRSTLYAEAAVVVFLVGVALLRRFIVRQRYLPRAQRRVRLFRQRVDRTYVSFTKSVERNFRLSARLFPHVVYWTAASFFAWLAPGAAGHLRDKLWVFATTAWPTMYAIYLVLVLRSQHRSNGEAGGSGGGTPVAVSPDAANPRAPVMRRTPVRTPGPGTPGAGTPARSPGSGLARAGSVLPQDVDRVLMYWVVLTVANCASLVANLIPENRLTPHVHTAAFFVALWMHLPGPGSGLQVVYASLEPLVHKYVRDLRMPDNGHAGTLKSLQSLLVFTRLLTKENAEVLASNITDSWMLVPGLFCFFTPSFLTNLGCLYVGMVVPAFNSIKTLGRRSSAELSDGWAALATSARGARVRWLTYWVAYGLWWHACWSLGWVLRIIPLVAHAQLAVLLWLQVPWFRGGFRLLEFAERCMDRWASGAVAGQVSLPPQPQVQQ
ncbi:unnamed protein product [Scytosiphon promiscuus]